MFSNSYPRIAIKYALWSFIAVLISSNIGCGDNKTDLTDYFYPRRIIDKPYEYRAIGDSMPPYTLKVAYKDNYWDIQRLDAMQRTEYSLRDSVVDGGIICSNYTLFQYDDKNLKTTIYPTINKGANTVFPFRVQKDGGAFPCDIQWKNSADGNETLRVIRNRHFQGMIDYVWKGTTVSCAEFLVKTQYRSDIKGEGTIAPESLGIERYAKGVGLIYTSSVVAGKTIEYVLQ